MEREFKDSGIEWIGKIPKEWKTCMFKHAYNISNVGESIDKNYCTENQSDLLFYTAGLKPIHTNYKGFPKWKYTNRNDLLLARNGTPYVYLPKYNSVYSDHIIRVDIKSAFCKAYVRYCLQLAISAVIVDSVSLATWSISIWDKQFIPVPILPKQQRIADYLDKKCGEIDELIALQEQMIAQLTDYKQSVITEAVTKGLNPDAELVPSSIDWIGDVPKGWNIVPLRYLGRTQNGISQSGDYFGEGFPFVSYSDVYKNYSLPSIFNGLAKSSKQDQKLFSVIEGDVFFTRTSETIDEIGFSSVCLKTVENAVFAGFLIRFRPYKNKIDKNFSKYYFRSNIHRAYFVKEMNLVTRASLSQELLKSLPVLLPPLSEQHAIATYLDTKCSEIDSLIAIKQQKIETLKDYKKSVIYEAVTGKMTV